MAKIGQYFKNLHTREIHQITGKLDESYFACSGAKMIIDNSDDPNKRKHCPLRWIGAKSFERAVVDGHIKPMLKDEAIKEQEERRKRMELFRLPVTINAS